ncbi:SDR family NAD(P)-dependent oxidoreductase [Streptomyces lasiicapitis]|uniref:SDR family NAD(P)-dependent oxidoreductase n=1 Tax=Streptomyces lasiicapitis TaxID=1923961 RepID=UPI001668B0C9|nr:SDR family NAD(P)-dependent oxidoreductase [Streptomyces lasiicapitis]
MTKIAVVAGASSGIGAATAGVLSRAGYSLVLGARRMDRLHSVAAPLGAKAIPLDVTDRDSVASFCVDVPKCDLLVNSAGCALGLSEVADADDAEWRWMYEVNVLGTMRMIRTLSPALKTAPAGHVILVGSIAGYQPYAGGAGYNAAKFAVRGVAGALRQELLGTGVRLTEIAPGHVRTEFALVRFGGDRSRADAVYAGMTPLAAEDVAEAIGWAASRPSHVNVDHLRIQSVDQATTTLVHREGSQESTGAWS